MRSPLLAACLGLTLIGAALAAGPQAPVMVGGDGDMDACSSQGEVRGLNPKGDGFLAVRDGPDSSFAMIDQLHEGDVVNLCAARNDWLGVVYGRDCGVGTPINPARAYTGPCKSGWVFQEFITLTAG